MSKNFGFIAFGVDHNINKGMSFVFLGFIKIKGDINL